MQSRTKILADNSLLPLGHPESPQTRRAGRPRGARNRRTADLGKYLAHRYGGMTTGQQLAELCMITARELREAKAFIREHELKGVSPMVIAQARRAHALAVALNDHQPAADRCSPKEAMAILIKAQVELMPYVHQKLPPKADGENAPPATVFMVPDGDGSSLPLIPDTSDDVDDQPIDFIDVARSDAPQVAPPKSHDDN